MGRRYTHADDSRRRTRIAQRGKYLGPILPNRVCRRLSLIQCLTFSRRQDRPDRVSFSRFGSRAPGWTGGGGGEEPPFWWQKKNTYRDSTIDALGFTIN